MLPAGSTAVLTSARCLVPNNMKTGGSYAVAGLHSVDYDSLMGLVNATEPTITGGFVREITRDEWHEQFSYGEYEFDVAIGFLDKDLELGGVKLLYMKYIIG
jgi:hypothetical protein